MTTETLTARKTTPRRAKSSKSGSRKRKKTSVRPGAQTLSARPARTSEAPTKKAIVLELLRREQGATTTDIAKATGWRNHSIRGFISGNVCKKMGVCRPGERTEPGPSGHRHFALCSIVQREYRDVVVIPHPELSVRHARTIGRKIPKKL